MLMRVTIIDGMEDMNTERVGRAAGSSVRSTVWALLFPAVSS